MFSAGFEMKSGRGATIVLQRGLSAKNIRLLLVDLRHLPAARGEALLELVDDRLIDIELERERLRQRFTREVIFSWPESAGGDE